MGHDELKSGVERHAGDQFIQWFNDQHGVDFRFEGRPGQAPDLLYSCGEARLYLDLEVSTAFGSQSWAKFQHEGVRRPDTAPTNCCASRDFASRLSASINAVLAKKATKRYGEDCVLVVEINEPFVNRVELEAVLPGVVVPEAHGFAGIYVLHEYKNVLDPESPPGVRVYTLLAKPFPPPRGA